MAPLFYIFLLLFLGVEGSDIPEWKDLECEVNTNRID